MLASSAQKEVELSIVSGLIAVGETNAKCLVFLSQFSISLITLFAQSSPNHT